MISALSILLQDARDSMREREREIHYVHWASKAYEDESVFMSEAHLMRNLMWHQNQKALSDFVIAILDEPRT